MEDIINKQAHIHHSTTLSMHKNSRTISKTKPKIRIIHIFAPEIIKTDVENFRELVQRLTGKPNDHHHQQKQKICLQKQRNPRREEVPRMTSPVHEKQVGAKKVELRSTSLGMGAVEKVKEEEEEEEEQILWNGVNSGEFLNGFADFHGFIHEFGEFPLLPLDSSRQMHGFEGTHQYA